MYTGITRHGGEDMLEECEVCGQSTGKLYTCKACGKRFCRYCGSFTDKLCIDCLSSGEDEYPPWTR
jgi:RecJ-like exonuclease